MFKQTVQTLLAGNIICQTAFADEHEYLQASANFDRVNEYLQPLDRKLTELESASAYYCTFTKIDQSNQKQIFDLFSMVRRDFRPLVEWLDILLIATGLDSPLRAKDCIKFSALLNSFENDQTLAERLRLISQMPPFKTNKIEPREQLATVFSKLEDIGYLKRHSQGSNSYFATAKFELIYLLIEFINDNEKLDLPELQSTQTEFLL